MRPEMLLAAAKSGRIDAAIIQRTALPPETIQNVINALLSSSVPFIYDIDDDLLAHTERADMAIQYEQYKLPILALLKAANVVTVSTHKLSSIYSSISKQVDVIPNMLSDRLWATAPLPRQHDGFIRAFYMGTLTHGADLEMVLPAFANISRLYPNFRLTVVGISQNADHISQIPWLERIDPPKNVQPYINFIPWLRKVASRCDFAIAPLVDNHFNHCKSDLKLLEYSALGLPIIATPLPQYQIDAPFLTLTDNSPQSWEKVLKHVIQTGLRNDRTQAMQRDWVLSQRMMAPTLSKFDDLIIEQITASLT